MKYLVNFPISENLISPRPWKDNHRIKFLKQNQSFNPSQY